jgi:hypothetical protein
MVFTVKCCKTTSELWLPTELQFSVADPWNERFDPRPNDVFGDDGFLNPGFGHFLPCLPDEFKAVGASTCSGGIDNVSSLKGNLEAVKVGCLEVFGGGHVAYRVSFRLRACGLGVARLSLPFLGFEFFSHVDVNSGPRITESVSGRRKRMGVCGRRSHATIRCGK